MNVLSRNDMDLGASVRNRDYFRIYAESFWGADHLHRTLEEAQSIVNAALSMESAAPIPSEENL
jgi:hypothetical protein